VFLDVFLDRLSSFLDDVVDLHVDLRDLVFLAMTVMSSSCPHMLWRSSNAMIPLCIGQYQC